MDSINRENFSVLISVYYKEEPEYLKGALESIWNNQTIKPAEIVLVKDGPLTSELDKVVDDFSKEAPLKVLALKENQGLGKALALGLQECTNELVARMDSDDIAYPDRFEKQITFFKDNMEISLLGGQIAEFDGNRSEINGYRKVPQDYRDIMHFATKRNPMNHMTVMFKKSSVLNVGNYLPFKGYEDYFLWVRMLNNGYKAENLKDNLVYARIGNNMLARRQGVVFFKEEIRLQKEFLSMGFINRIEYFRNILLRAVPRLMPIFMLQIIYKTLRK
ncbi:MAG: glycosyltransferase [Bacteroidales bacterium]